MNKIVKSIRENTRNYAGKNGTLYIHMITLAEPVNVEGDDVLEFEYHSQTTKCEKFVAGQAAEFETEKRTNGQFTNYKIKPVQLKPAFAGAGFVPRPAGKFEPKNQEVITALSCASTAANFYQQREANPAAVIKFAEELYAWAQSKSKVWYHSL